MRTRHDRTRTRRQRGGAVAELAITMPFVFLLMIGAVDFGRMWTVSTRLSDAAYAGAAYGAQTAETAKDTEGIRDVALHELGLISDGSAAILTGPTVSQTVVAGSWILAAAKGGHGGGTSDVGSSGSAGSSGSSNSSGSSSSSDSSGSSGSTAADGGSDSEGKVITVDDYEILVERYCRCEDDSTVDCDTGSCTAGSGSRRTYVRVNIGTNFTTIFDYPGIPPVIELEREARLRAR